VQYIYYFLEFYQHLFKEKAEQKRFTIKEVLERYGLPYHFISGASGNKVTNAATQYTRSMEHGKFRLFKKHKKGDKFYYISDEFLDFINIYKNTHLVNDFMNFDFVTFLK